MTTLMGGALDQYGQFGLDALVERPQSHHFRALDLGIQALSRLDADKRGPAPEGECLTQASCGFAVVTGIHGLASRTRQSSGRADNAGAERRSRPSDFSGAVVVSPRNLRTHRSVRTARSARACGASGAVGEVDNGPGMPLRTSCPPVIGAPWVPDEHKPQ